MFPKVYLAIPLMNEFENISNLMKDIFAQDYDSIEIRICVNQPEAWWEEENKFHICENNQKTIKYLSGISKNLKVIDKSSRGLGWDSKKFGVGWARKLVMDEIADEAANDDVILTLDGDTHIKPTYISSVVNTIELNPKAVALSVPYYHPLNGNEETDRNILRYEIYMRYYSLNLYRINNPYNFTALGSAIGVPVWAYKRVRGITPHKSGEDFYFLLKLKKFGKLLNWNPI
jgi:cellulose synthase/poly-beta-1,6-N-acetylglucosamine synthase-like glycosyltransferase